MHNMPTRNQNKSNLTAIYIDKKLDHIKKGNDNRPQDAKISPQQYHFLDNIINQYQYCAMTRDQIIVYLKNDII